MAQENDYFESLAGYMLDTLREDKDGKCRSVALQGRHWLPVNELISTPEKLTDSEAFHRVVPTETPIALFGNFSLNWEGVRIGHHLNYFGDTIPGTHIRKFAEETVLLWIINPERSAYCWVRLLTHCENRIRNSTRFLNAHSGITQHRVMLEELAEDEFDAFVNQHQWFEEVESFFGWGLKRVRSEYADTPLVQVPHAAIQGAQFFDSQIVCPDS